MSGWRPLRSWLFVSVAVRAAAYLAWSGGELTLTRWDPGHGPRGPERRLLDPVAGIYRITET